MKRDLELEVFLRTTAAKLASGSKELSESPLGVFLWSNRDAPPQNIALPGNRIYIHTQWLKNTEFESEMAAGLALQLAHLHYRHLLSRLDDTSKTTETHSSGGAVKKFHEDEATWHRFFDFSLDQRMEASEKAIEWMYQAGYDPRGMVAYWTRCKDLAETPGTAAEYEKLLAVVYRTLARVAPIRNPIVKSTTFTVLQRNMQRL